MDEKLRIPGEKIASIEEYLPGDNTFEDNDSRNNCDSFRDFKI